MIGRHVDFPRSEREPADADSSGKSAADSDAHGEMRTANPRNKRGRVNGPNINYADHNRPRWRGHPTPNTANGDPSSVMKGSKTPRRIIHPGVTPRGDIGPVAEVIRSPADDGNVRKPNGAVLRGRAPAAVFVKVFVTDNVVRNVASGNGVVDAGVTFGGPVVKIVAGVVPAFDVGVDLVGAIKGADFLRMDSVSGAAAGNFALAIADSNDGGVASFVHIDLVIAWTE